MSIECGECGRDGRGGHATTCSRYRPYVCDTCGTVDSDDEEGCCTVVGCRGTSSEDKNWRPPLTPVQRAD